jgi:membrane-bound metal-dependent hydrolase YbcI (DUF457 family)
LNTIGGIVWFVNFNNENENFLKTEYYVETIVLLSIPLFICSLFVLIFVVVVIKLFINHRRERRMMRLEEEGFYDFE